MFLQRKIRVVVIVILYMYENKNKQIAAGYYIAIIDNSVKLVCQHKRLLWSSGGECGSD